MAVTSMNCGFRLVLTSGSIQSGQIGNAAVNSGNISSGQIGSMHIASGVINAELIGSGAVGSEELGDNAVVSGKIASGVISWINISSGAILSGSIGDSAVTSGNIASGQIGLDHLASGLSDFFTITSGEIVSGLIGNAAVNSGNIGSGQVGAMHIASGVINSELIASGAVGPEELGDNAVVSGKLASGVVAWFNMASGAINSGNVGIEAVTSGNIASGQIGLVHLYSGTMFSIANASDNRIITSLGSGVNQANAETNLNYDGTTLSVISTSGQSNVFLLEGVSGNLVTVTDTSNNVGNKVLQVNAPNSGQFSFSSYGYLQVNSAVLTGQTANVVAYQVPDTASTAAFFDYSVIEAGGARRAGTVMVVWDPNANTVSYNDVSTSDLGGSTVDIEFSAAINSDLLELVANITGGSWDIRLSARLTP